jgi:hypothetical protein
LRRAVLDKFHNCCAICYRKQSDLDSPLQVHHIYPWSAGGYTVIENSIPLCNDTCHQLADLGALSPEYLMELNQQTFNMRIDKLLDVSQAQSIDEMIKNADSDNLSSTLAWEDRLNMLIDNWTIISRMHKLIPRKEFIDTSAKLLWSISKVITTHVPEKNSIIQWRHISIPRNRIVGINLAEKARTLIKQYSEPNDPTRADLMIGMTHTLSTHYRSFGYYTKAFRQDKKHMNILLSARDASDVVKNPSLRAYYLSAYCVDLAALKKREAREILINKGLKWAFESDNMHSIADTIVRVAELDLRLGMPEACIEYLEQKHAFGSGWDLIFQDIPIVQAIAHKICMQAHARLGNWADFNSHYDKAINIADAENLADQKRKIMKLGNEINN